MKIVDYDDNGCWWWIIEIIKQRNLDFSINAIFFYTVRLVAFFFLFKSIHFILQLIENRFTCIIQKKKNVIEELRIDENFLFILSLALTLFLYLTN